MNKRVTLIMVVVLGLMALAGAVMGCAGAGAAGFEPAAAPAGATTAASELSAGLMANITSPEVSGRAEFDVDDGGAAELEVDVRAAGSAAGRTLGVFIDGTSAGSLTLDDDGRGALRAGSQDGQAVPAVSAGSTIELRQDGQVLASGQFTAAGDDDNANDNSDDDNANDNSDDDNANDNGDDDNANDNGDDDNANDNGDDDDNANDNGDDDNANDKGDDDNANDNGDDDNANDNGEDDDNSGSSNDNDGDDDDNSGSGGGDDNDNDDDDDNSGTGDDNDNDDDANDND